MFRGRLLSVVAALALLPACTALVPEMTEPLPSYTGPVPGVTATPADEALYCLANRREVKRFGRTFAVHVISDSTAKFVQEEDGGVVPRDVAGMVITSLQRAGVRQVNRSNTAVSEFELKLAQDQILGDGRKTKVGDQEITFRPIEKGSFRGSDYVIDGAITQLDFNTFTGGLEGTYGGVGGGARIFALTAAADLRVTNTRTSQIVLAESYSKQAVGAEVFASVFRFFSSELFDVRIGEKSQEGLHAGIRWLLAEATYDVVATLTKHDGSCDRFLPEVTREFRKKRAERQQDFKSGTAQPRGDNET